ncbi:MAG: DMT family transporter [Alphaproteobacteria bacterium]|nr:DMT family transporter [Alphaproteobacteria bacterium]MBU0796374.1 DMT family transporter [Alphaproteobacteria bacterium]MBU0886069.1 DMT family transporter [Alphaproteobacteria bacterium]MBU1812058.1 DMT family transporter [Alphaproteobacteria bacterium]
MVWMALSGLIFASFMSVVRLLSQEMHPVQVSFLRYGLGLVFLVPLLMRMQAADFREARLSLHALRGITHGLAVMLWFYAMSRISIAEVSAIGFTSPVFATLGAAIVLGERLRMRRIMAIAAGLLGAFIIIRPGFTEVDPGAIAMLMAAPIFGFSDVIAKLLMRRESGPAVVGFLSLFVTLVSLGPAIYVWEHPTLEQWGLLALTAGLANLGHLTMVQAFKIAEMSAVQPVKFLQLFWAALIGFLVFSELPSVWTWIGSAIIVLSSYYIARREAALKAKQP